MAGSVAAALVHSSEVRSARADVAQAGASVRIAGGGYYPTLTGSTGTGGIDSYEAEMRLTQTLYDWGRTAEQVRGARAGRTEAEMMLWAARENTAFEAAEAFIGLHRMRELELAALDNVEAHERIAELARIRTEGGVGDATEIGLASVRLGEARSALEDARGNVRIASNLYITRMGAEPPAVLEPVPELTMVFDGQEMFETALDAAPTVQIAYAQEKQALSRARSEKKGLFPRLEAVAYVRSFDEMETQDTGVGLRFTAPTFNGFTNFDRIEAANLQAESARWQAETARRDVRLRVRDLIERTPTLERQLEILRTQHTEALRLRDLYEIQFKLGRRSLVDFLNVQADIYRIARTIADTRHTIFNLQYAAAQGLGRLEAMVLAVGEPGS